MESKRITQARKRLKHECEELKSYQKLADKYEMSKGMIYNFIEYGDVPACKDAQIKLGLLRDLEKKNAGDRARRKAQREELERLRSFLEYMIEEANKHRQIKSSEIFDMIEYLNL